MIKSLASRINHIKHATRMAPMVQHRRFAVDIQQDLAMYSAGRPRKGEVKFMLNGHFPFDVNGVWALPQQPERPIVKKFLELRGVNYQLMHELLTEKFQVFLNAIVEQDQKKIQAMAEKRFAEKLISNLTQIKNKQVKYIPDRSLLADIIVPDSTDFGDLRGNLVSDNSSTYIVDSMIIKGVSVNRDENDCNYDYKLMKDRDHEGMRFYMHKYFSGHMHYYQHLRFKQHHEKLLEILEKQEARLQKTPKPKRVLDANEPQTGPKTLEFGEEETNELI